MDELKRLGNEMALVEIDPDADPAPGVLRWVISCDESGIEGKSNYYGFGALWMSWQRRGDFQRLIRELRERHGYTSEIKWTNLRPHTAPFYRELIELFFRTPWLCFHCVVVPRGIVDRSLHQNDMEVAWAKHFTMLLTNKIELCLQRHKDREQTFRILVDVLPSRYKKADERIEIIANRVLARVFGEKRPVDAVLARDSKSALSIQLCDLLLGTVLAAWRGEATAPLKLETQSWVASHLGWQDLRADTRPSERKFNVWVFNPKGSQERTATTRKATLKYPYVK